MFTLARVVDSLYTFWFVVYPSEKMRNPLSKLLETCSVVLMRGRDKEVDPMVLKFILVLFVGYVIISYYKMKPYLFLSYQEKTMY